MLRHDRTPRMIVLSALVTTALLPVATTRSNGDATCLYRTPPPAGLEALGAWPYGSSLAVDVDPVRDLVFLASGGAVLTIDVADPTTPLLVSDDLRTGGLIADLFYDVSDQQLYAACGEGGLEIWDVSTPVSPALIACTEVIYVGTEVPVRGVDVFGDYAIVECSYGYVHSLDVSDPANPVEVAFNGSMGNPSHDIYVSQDGQIHSTGAQRYQRIKINPDGTLNTSGSREFDFGAGATFGDSDVAYVGYGSFLYILDLHHAAFAPWSTRNVGGIADIVVEAGTAYIVNRDGLHVWDVSVPTNPVLVGSLPVDWFPKHVVVSEGLAYVSTGHEGLRIIELGDGSSPTEIGRFDVMTLAYRVDKVGDVAYVAYSSSGLVALDLSDLDRPELLGRLDIPGTARDLDVDGDLVYVADSDAGLRIVDVSDPMMPVEIGFNEARDGWRVRVQGSFAYMIESVVNEPYWLRIFDISVPTSPVELGALTLDTIAWDLEVSGSHVFVANGTLGMRVVDVSDPTTPVEVARYSVPDVHDLQLVGDIAFVTSADFAGGLITLDISDPTNPTVLDRYNPTGGFRPFHVAVSGARAYLGDPVASPELFVFDISDPTNLINLGSFTPPGDMSQLHAFGSLLVVANGRAGVQLYQDLAVVGVPGVSQGPGIARVTNAPNPFTPCTTFQVTDADGLHEARLEIIDAAGRRIRAITLGSITPGGEAHIDWDGRDDAGRPAPAGVYYYRLVHGHGASAARRTTLIR